MATVLGLLAAALGSAWSPPASLGAQQAPRPEVPTAPVGWIGVSVEMSGSLDVEGRRADRVVVTGVQGGGPAAVAGVRSGDRLVALNGRSPRDGLASMLAGIRPGDPVTLEVVRNGRSRTFQLFAGHRPPERPAPAMGTVLVRADTLADRLYRAMDSLRVHVVARAGATGARTHVRVRREAGRRAMVVEQVQGTDTVRELVVPSLPAVPFRLLVTGSDTVAGEDDRGPPPVVGWSPTAPPHPPRGPLAPYLLGQNRVAGAEIVELKPELAEYFSVQRGVLVVEVAPGTPAAHAGLQPGDVLTHIGDTPVGTLVEVRRTLATLRDSLAVHLVRRGETRTLLIRR